VKSPVITAAILRRNGACADKVARFAKLFPKGTAVTLRAALKAADAGLSLGWFARKLLSASARAEYDKARAPAQAEYNKATAPAWAEYDKARAPARAEYNKARAPAWAEYGKATAPAWAEYNKATAAAQAEYYKATASALVAAWNKGRGAE
jgi:hypothetical protein